MIFPQETTDYEGKKVTFVWMRGVNFEDYKPIIQCYGIVINADQEILLARKNNSQIWSLPGGTVEKGETWLETLKRELLEEVDVEIENAKPLGLQKAFEVGKEDKAVYQARYVVSNFELLPQTIDPDEGSVWERKFFPSSKVNNILKWGNAADHMFKDAIQAL